jgi:hypothetical protein
VSGDESRGMRLLVTAGVSDVAAVWLLECTYVR